MHPLLTKHPKIIPSLRHGDVCDSPFVDAPFQCWVSIIKTPSHPFLLWGWFLRFITAVLKKSKNLHCFPKVWKCQIPTPSKKRGVLLVLETNGTGGSFISKLELVVINKIKYPPNTDLNLFWVGMSLQTWHWKKHSYM